MGGATLDCRRHAGNPLPGYRRLFPDRNQATDPSRTRHLIETRGCGLRAVASECRWRTCQTASTDSNSAPGTLVLTFESGAGLDQDHNYRPRVIVASRLGIRQL